MKRIDPAAQADLTQLRDHTTASSRNTSIGVLLYELYALFRSLVKINLELIREAIIVQNRLPKNSCKMRRKVGKQIRYAQRPFIAITSEHIAEHLFGNINAYRAQHTGNNLGNLGRQLAAL